MDERIDKLERFEKRASNELVVVHQLLKNLVDSNNHLINSSKDLCANKEFKEHQVSFEQYIAGITTSLKDYADKHNDLLEKIRLLESLVLGFESQVALVNSNMSILINAIAPHMQACNAFRATAQQNVDAALLNIQAALKEELSNIPKHESVDVEKLEASLIERLRADKDEITQTTSRCITNQSRIHILEKKVAKLGGV